MYMVHNKHHKGKEAHACWLYQYTGSTFEEMVTSFKIKFKDFPKYRDLATF